MGLYADEALTCHSLERDHAGSDAGLVVPSIYQRQQGRAWFAFYGKA